MYSIRYVTTLSPLFTVQSKFFLNQADSYFYIQIFRSLCIYISYYFPLVETSILTPKVVLESIQIL